MSGNCAQRAVPTKRCKRTVGVCVCSCSLCVLFVHKSLIVPEFGCRVYFLFDPFIYPQLYLFMCVCMHNRCVTAFTRGCRCVLVTLSFYKSVFRHNTPVFHCGCVFLRSPRDVSVWGNRKKHCVCVYVCAHCLILVFVINPALVEGTIAQ